MAKKLHQLKEICNKCSQRSRKRKEEEAKENRKEGRIDCRKKEGDVCLVKVRERVEEKKGRKRW